MRTDFFDHKRVNWNTYKVATQNTPIQKITIYRSYIVLSRVGVEHITHNVGTSDKAAV